jgi:hypothetical protein
MLTASLRRKTILLLLAAVLAAPWASVAGPRTEGDQPAQAVQPGALELLDRFWGFLRNTWNKDGCHIDPFGRCTPQPPVQTKEGCNVDPNGNCRR